MATGRALSQVECFIRQEILPYYSNRHTEASLCSAYMSEMRAAARQIIASNCNAGSDCSVVFTGAGATAAINRLPHLLGLSRAVAQDRLPTVLLGPYEHHSNILP